MLNCVSRRKAAPGTRLATWQNDQSEFACGENWRRHTLSLRRRRCAEEKKDGQLLTTTVKAYTDGGWQTERRKSFLRRGRFRDGYVCPGEDTNWMQGRIGFGRKLTLNRPNPGLSLRHADPPTLIGKPPAGSSTWAARAAHSRLAFFRPYRVGSAQRTAMEPAAPTIRCRGQTAVFARKGRKRSDRYFFALHTFLLSLLGRPQGDLFNGHVDTIRNWLNLKWAEQDVGGWDPSVC